MSTNLKYLVLGATGATGKNALTASLASPSVSSVHSLGRRNPELPPTTPGLEKLHTGTIDFDALLKSDPEEVRKLKAVEADVVVIALGTTRAAVSFHEPRGPGEVLTVRYRLEGCLSSSRSTTTTCWLPLKLLGSRAKIGRAHV
mgnify:CR=1 FL=1